MAAASSSTCSASRHLIHTNNKAAPSTFRQQSQCLLSLPTSPAFHSDTHSRLTKTTAYCGKIARNVVALATGTGTGEAQAAVTTTEETPEIVKKIQQTWEKIDDKYAVTSLAVAGGVALCATAGMISAIDKLPLIPGVLELVGIGYTGWFAYKNLAFTPEREALIQKVKDTYNDILGIS